MWGKRNQRENWPFCLKSVISLHKSGSQDTLYSIDGFLSPTASDHLVTESTLRPALLDQLTDLFESKQQQLYVSAMAITKDRASAEDVVLESLLAVAELKQAPNDLAAYLFRVVRNKALHLNKRNAKHTDDSSIEHFIDTSSQSAEQLIFVRQVLQHLESLESNQQQVLIMKLFGDLTFDEIAKITDNSANTVASRYRRGLLQLKEKIHEPAI